MAANAPAAIPYTRRKVLKDIEPVHCPIAHRGLLLDKFVANQGMGKGNARQQLIDEVCGREWEKSTDPLYDAAFKRWQALWKAEGTRVIEAETAAPLAIGHGAKGVLDGGVRLHRTYGLPLIPASGVRGAVSAFVDTTLGQQNLELWAAGSHPSAKRPIAQGRYHCLLFGDTKVAGRLCFEDAWWVPVSGQSPLRRDVLTPHHKNYYTGNGSGPRPEPAETDEPVPVTIPVVAENSSFLFVVHWRHQPKDDPGKVKHWLDLAELLLRQTLEHQGLGAKRSQGYGRLQEPTAGASAAVPKGPSLAAQPWIQRLQGLKSHPDQFLQQIDSLKKQLDDLEQQGHRDLRPHLLAMLKEAKKWQANAFTRLATSRAWMNEWTEP